MVMQQVYTKMKSVSIREEKDQRDMRIYNMSIIGLLLGFDIVILAFAVVLYQTFGDTFSRASVIWGTAIPLILAAIIGMMGTFAMYRRLLTFYAVLVFALAIVFFAGFVVLFEYVHDNGQGSIIKECEYFIGDLDENNPLKNGDCNDYVDLLTNFSYFVSVMTLFNALLMLFSAFCSIVLSYSEGTI